MAAEALLEGIGKKFGLPGEFSSAAAYGTGHINDTYLATYECGGQRRRYIHQRLNTEVFPNPVELMDNVSRVLAHLAGKITTSNGRSTSVRTLELIAATDGLPYYFDESSGFWRTFHFIEGAKSLDFIETPDQAREAAAAIGRFQCTIADMPAPRLHDTIADFHNTPKRFQQFLRAVNADSAGRASLCTREVEFARSRSTLASALASQIDSGAIPERIAHNDTKLNNVMLDTETGAGLCVIDLDTVMPGSVLYDFGDMVRTATMTVPEDEPDLSNVAMDKHLFKAIVEGYAGSVASWLNAVEIANLVLSARVMTFEVGIRFLTDHLNGDEYFKTESPGQNLARSHTQFALLRSMEANAEFMEEVVGNAIAVTPAVDKSETGE